MTVSESWLIIPSKILPSSLILKLNIFFSEDKGVFSSITEYEAFSPFSAVTV